MAAIKNKRTKRLLILSLFVLVVMGCFIIFRPSHHSTVYKGKTIDQWLEETTKTETHDAAIQTLNDAGELALPDLVRAMTRRESFFYRNVNPRLPGPLKRLVPQDKRSHLQLSAVAVIRQMPLGADQIVPALKKAAHECDEGGIYWMLSLLRYLALRDSTGLHEVAKVIPELHQALTSTNGRYGDAAREIQLTQNLVDAQVQIETWVPPGVSLEDAKQIMENHQFECWLRTHDFSGDSKPGTLLDCVPRGAYCPNGTNPIIGVHFILSLTNNKVSSVYLEFY